MRWSHWFVTFEQRVKSEQGQVRSIVPAQVKVLARSSTEALALAFRRAPQSTLRASDTQSGALWGWAKRAGTW